MKTALLSDFMRKVKRDRQLLILMIIPFAYFIVFNYVPMYGVIMAFKEFSISKGIWGSEWVGFKHFLQFFKSFYFFQLIRNTFLLSIYHIIFGFPVPIIFALFLNEVRNQLYKRFIQTVSYLPYFISIVIICGMIVNFLSPNDGIINVIIKRLGGETINFLNEPRYFRTIYVSTSIWQVFGYGSIIYLATISGIDPVLYDAASVDGASRLRKIIHVTIPSLMPTIIILLILNMGSILNTGFEKTILLYNPATYDTADIIGSYTYRAGIINGQYSFATAVGLFAAAVNIVIIVIVNKIARKVSEISLW